MGETGRSRFDSGRADWCCNANDLSGFTSTSNSLATPASILREKNRMRLIFVQSDIDKNQCVIGRVIWNIWREIEGNRDRQKGLSPLSLCKLQQTDVVKSLGTQFKKTLFSSRSQLRNERETSVNPGFFISIRHLLFFFFSFFTLLLSSRPKLQCK